jgi:hypothetical protein
LSVKKELALLKNLSDAPLLGRLLALPTNNRLGWKGFPGKTLYPITKILKLRTEKVLLHWTQLSMPHKKNVP